MLEAARQDQVPIEPPLAWRHLGEGHPNLKGDSCLFGQDSDGTDRTKHRQYGIIQLANRWAFAAKMIAELVSAARVRLIPIGEPPLAPCASP
jgi:hypothetical protein